MDLRGRHIVIVGLGKTGISVLRWLAGQGAKTTVSEMKGETDLDQSLAREARQLATTLETGGHRKETLLSADTIIVSPGVPLDQGPVLAAMEKGIPIFGEMELAVRLMKTPMVAVTGTNGKSTVTAFLGAMLERAGLKVFVGGNIGTPLIAYAGGDQKADYAVVEVSSFQLDTMESFHPKVAILLNLSPDHLDRYSGYRAYVQSKLSIFKNQGPGDVAVLHDGDPLLRGFEPPGGPLVLRYGAEKKKNRLAYLEEGSIKAFLPGEPLQTLPLAGWALPGLHNRENLLAAVLAGLALGVPPAVIQATIETFRGLPHRQELVGRIRGVTFYDDSKATNVDAALRSMASFDSPVILIAGGRDKGGDYGPLARAAKGKVRKAVLLGESRLLMARAFEGLVPCSMAGDMRDAVGQALTSALPGEIVLLAPACSSFDMFTDYTHRGRVFREEVERLSNVRT